MILNQVQTKYDEEASFRHESPNGFQASVEMATVGRLCGTRHSMEAK